MMFFFVSRATLQILWVTCKTYKRFVAFAGQGLANNPIMTSRMDDAEDQPRGDRNHRSPSARSDSGHVGLVLLRFSTVLQRHGIG